MYLMEYFSFLQLIGEFRFCNGVGFITMEIKLEECIVPHNQEDGYCPKV